MTKPRALLLHNPEAGFENHSTASLARFIRDRGFRVDHAEPDDAKALKAAADLFVIAGGDGTVGRIARKLIGRGVPVGILPLGTANNIATNFGIHGTPEDIIAQWDMERFQSFEVGVAQQGKKERFFLEAAGFGLFPKLIRARKKADKEEKNTREEELRDALQHKLAILAKYAPHHCRITMDGEVVEGDYLMVEAMNTQFAGANLQLAPNAQSDDGLLDLVLIPAREREALAQYLADCQNDRQCNHPFPIYRAHNIAIRWQGKYYHIDDTAHKTGKPVEMEIGLRRKALRILVPPGNPQA